MSERPMWRRYVRFVGPDLSADLEEELRFHLEMRVDELVEQGMDPVRARAEAERRLGSLGRLKEECMAIGERAEREQRRRERIGVLLREIAQAGRALMRNPGFAAVAVLTLSLGIGATTSIYAMVDAVVLSPLRYPDSDRLVNVGNSLPLRGPDVRYGVSPAGYFHFRENSRTLEDLGIYTMGATSITGDGPAERVEMAVVSSSLFNVLRARPALGRLLTPEDDRPASFDEEQAAPGPAEPVVVLSHDFWMRRYGGDPDIIGKTIRVSGNPVPVVGVLERGFGLPDQKVDVWRPLGLNPNGRATNWHTFVGIGRLSPGATPEAAERELAGFTERFTEIFPSAYSESFMSETGFTPDVVSWQRLVIGEMGRTLWILLGAVGLVLLIAAANVTNLFLVRADGRHREFAIRSALGATRGRLARLFLTECLATAVLGGLLGIGLAYVGIRVLVAHAPEGLPRLGEVGITPAVVGFAIAVSVAVGLLVGLFPVLRSRGRFSATVLREAGRGSTTGRQRNAARNLLVVMQMALALVLLASAGLLLQSFQRLRSVDPGIEPENVLTMELSLPWSRYGSYSTVARFHEELVQRLEELPGVASAGLSGTLPLAGGTGCAAVFTRERTTTEEQREAPCVAVTLATPGFYETLGIDVLGRAPTWSDLHQGSGAVVVSRALADRLWPGQDPIGKGIRGNGYAEPYYTVVGVTEDVRFEGLDQAPTEIVFFPLVPLEGAGLWQPLNPARLVVRSTTGGPEPLAAAIRGAIQEMDPEVPISNVRAMEHIVARSMSRVSFAMLLLAISAVVALTLGAVGLYGVLSYVVGQRRTELGIRLALGARVDQISRLVIGRAMVLTLIGVTLGIGAALVVTRILRALLFEVDPTNWVVLALVSALLAGVAMVASYLPARRAGRVDPMVSLRAD